MKEKLTIALVAHDHRKADMVDWVKFNAAYLSKHHLVCTGTTGSLIRQAFNDLNLEAEVDCMQSGPMGGLCLPDILRLNAEGDIFRPHQPIVPLGKLVL